MENTEMFVVACLGNPGKKYAKNRHNAGFLLGDYLADLYRISLASSPFSALAGKGSLEGREVLIVMPQTYMNNSGIAVRQAVDSFTVGLEQCLVIADDFALPLGTLRLRRGGSDGGHNGLSSVVYHLESDAFPRLRCGIGSPAMPVGEETATFVLSPFEPGEREPAAAMIRRAADAVESFVEAGIEKTMNVFNKAP